LPRDGSPPSREVKAVRIDVIARAKPEAILFKYVYHNEIASCWFDPDRRQFSNPAIISLPWFSSTIAPCMQVDPSRQEIAHFQ
jgi:hypothetical protein